MTINTAANLLLQTLPERDKQALYKKGEMVDIDLDSLICDACLPITHVYFPVTGYISLVAATKEHPHLETALIGAEGMLGASLVLNVDSAPTRAVVKLAGSALRFTTSEFMLAMNDHPRLHRVIQRYLFVTMIQQSHIVSCTHFHEVGSRLARWLLMVHDRVHGDEIYITHSALANLLGVRRSAVSIAASRIQKQQLIRYSRGEITIMNRQGLEQASCGCYDALCADYNKLFSPVSA
ncbi:MAG: CRP-like cAMP-binding protein [Candidatus Azotimanducaceae bacterium]|jgi:CRP-like cAMP-binding protein